MPDFIIITGKEINKIVDCHIYDIINIVEKAYLIHNRKNTLNPDTYFLRFPSKKNARIAALPAYVGEDVNFAGIKWISSFPDNIRLGIPRASAVLILNDFNTGYPIACMESSILSAARTAASAVIGAFELNKKSKKTQKIGFIGNGVISKYIFDFFNKSDWEFTEINLFDINLSYSKSFLSYINKEKKVKVNIHSSIKSICNDSSIIVFATTAEKPYINNPHFFSHNPIILNISLRDISPEIILNSYNIVDDISHCLKEKTSTHLAYLKIKKYDFISTTIGSILDGKSTVDHFHNKPKIFSPFGMGILDITLASYIYHYIIAGNKGFKIPDFFHEINRW